MLIKTICTRELVTIGRDDTASRATELMRKNHVGDVLVVEKKHDKNVAIGIVTDRDIVVEIVAAGLDPRVITVGDIMLPVIFTIEENLSVFDAIRQMTSKGIRRLPVITNNEELVGIITLDDLFLLMAKEFCSFAKLLSKEQQNEIEKRR